MRVLTVLALALAMAAPASAAPPSRSSTSSSARASGSWMGVYVTDRQALISDVLPKTPAARAGLRAGDLVIKVGKAKVGDAGTLIATVSALKPGSTVDLLVERGYQQKRVVVSVVVERKPGPSEMLRRRFLDQPLRHFTLPQVGGGGMASEDLLGDVVVIEHFGTWCQVCKSTFQTLNEFRDRGAVVLALSSEERGTLNRYIDSTPPAFPVLEDYMGRVQRRYDARTVPLLMVVDRSGIIRHIGVGGEAAELDLAFAAVQRALVQPVAKSAE